MTEIFDLARLLAPLSVETFFDQYHEKAHLIVERDQADFYGSLLTMRDIDHIVTSTGLRHPAMRLVKDGDVTPLADYSRDFPWGQSTFDRVIDPDRVTHLFQQGATIVLEALHRQWQPLGYLCRSLEAHFGHPVQTNVYVTPRRSQGFAAHYDSHDVFVLQLAGSKRWRIYEGPMRLPGRRQPFVKNEHPPGPLIRELELNAGDLLYLPRGYMHEAATSDTDSLHITVGLLPYSWYDVFAEALKAIEGDERFRQSLPPGILADPTAATRLQTGFQERLDALARQTDLAAVLAGIARRFTENRWPLLDGALEGAHDWESVAPETRLRRRPGLLFELHDDAVAESTGAVLAFHRKRIELPAFAMDALRVLASGEVVRPLDLPGLAQAGQLVLVRRLVREGFLIIDEDPAR